MDFRVSPGWQTRLACPKCCTAFGPGIGGSAREVASTVVECTSCGAVYKVKDGVVNFGVTDAFYDEHGFISTGRDFSRSLIGRLGMYYARHHYLYDISRTVAPGSRVIEIGCGGGSHYLASRYDMLGVEVSAASVRHVANTYPTAVQATVASLPLVDGCADAVVSSCLLEHLGEDVVGSGLAEMARVLRPGGVMVHYFDLEAGGPFHRWARRQPWYQTIFVSSKGHFGFRPLYEWRRLFIREGFQILGSRLFCKSWLQDLSIWASLDDPLVAGVPRVLGKAAVAIRRKTSWASDVAVSIMNDCLDPWLPECWASKTIMQFRKHS